jgi:hypothetical protein
MDWMDDQLLTIQSKLAGVMSSLALADQTHSRRVILKFAVKLLKHTSELCFDRRLFRVFYLTKGLLS